MHCLVRFTRIMFAFLCLHWFLKMIVLFLSVICCNTFLMVGELVMWPLYVTSANVWKQKKFFHDTRAVCVSLENHLMRAPNPFACTWEVFPGLAVFPWPVFSDIFRFSATLGRMKMQLLNAAAENAYILIYMCVRVCVFVKNREENDGSVLFVWLRSCKSAGKLLLEPCTASVWTAPLCLMVKYSASRSMCVLELLESLGLTRYAFEERNSMEKKN